MALYRYVDERGPVERVLMRVASRLYCPCGCCWHRHGLRARALAACERGYRALAHRRSCGWGGDHWTLGGIPF